GRVEVDVAGNVHPEQLTGGLVAEHPREGRVDHEEPARDRRGEDADRRELDDPAVAAAEGAGGGGPSAGGGPSGRVSAPGRKGDGPWVSSGLPRYAETPDPAEPRGGKIALGWRPSHEKDLGPGARLATPRSRPFRPRPRGALSKGQGRGQGREMERRLEDVRLARPGQPGARRGGAAKTARTGPRLLPGRVPG